jgi:putative lipoic acid-binding regulatory protein
MKVLDNSTPTRPEINYPTQWGFKIIGKDPKKLLECIKKVMGEKKHDCTLGNRSKTGKFHSYNASCSVESEAERNKIFKYFETDEDVNMVM